MSIIFSDNFDSDTVGSLPAGFTALTGAWAVAASGGVSGANALHATNNGNGDEIFYTGAQHNADGVYSFTQKWAGTGAVFGLLFRFDNAGQNGYFFGGAPSTTAAPNAFLFKRVGGAYSQVGSTAALPGSAYAAGDNFTQEVTFAGSQIDFRMWNTTQGQTRPASPSVSFTDTTYVGAGYAGARLGAAGANNGIDDFTISSLPPVPTAVYSDNFDGDTVGALPSGWRVNAGTWAVAASGAVSGANALKATNSGSGDEVFYNATQHPADAVYSFTQKWAGNLATYGLLFRFDAAGQNGYFFGGTPSATGSPTALLFKRVAGSYSQVGATSTLVGPNYASGDNFTQEVTFTGSQIDFRMWNTTQGQARPLNPSATLQDATFTASGYAGARLGAAGINNGIDDFAVTLPPTYQIVARNSAAVYYAPYVWHDDGTSINANSTGSYIKFGFTGNTLALNLVGLSGLTYYPVVRAIVDGGSPVDVQLTPYMTQAVFGTAFGAGAHQVKIVVPKINEETGCWTLANAVKITGFATDPAATISASTGLAAKNMLIYGDSRIQGVRVYGTTPVYPTGMDGTVSVAPLIAADLGAELGQVGYGGQGYNQAGTGGQPALNAAYGLYSAGASRLGGGLLSPQPDYIACFHGGNGVTLQSDVATFITNARAMAPAAIIYMCVDMGGFCRAQVTAATNAAIAAGDLKVILIDMGPSYSVGINGDGNGNAVIGAPTAQSADEVHPLAATNVTLEARYYALMHKEIVWPTNGTLTTISGFLASTAITLTGPGVDSGYIIQDPGNQLQTKRGATAPPVDVGGVAAITFTATGTLAGYQPLVASLALHVTPAATAAPSLSVGTFSLSA